MPENWRQCEIFIVINHKSQDSTAKQFKLNLSFNLLVQEFLISVNIWRSYWDKWLIVSYALFALKFVVKDAELAGYKSKRTCV